MSGGCGTFGFSSLFSFGDTDVQNQGAGKGD